MQIMKNIQETLVNYQGLIKLVSQLETIPVPLQSVNEIEESITQLNATITNLDNMRWMDAFESSTKALKVSNNAFFHKDMVQQAYFPEEHKMAVYSPLMGPFCTIMLMAIVRGVKELRQWSPKLRIRFHLYKFCTGYNQTAPGIFVVSTQASGRDLEQGKE